MHGRAVAGAADALVGELVFPLMVRQQERERIERDRLRIEAARLLASASADGRRSTSAGAGRWLRAPCRRSTGPTTRAARRQACGRGGAVKLESIGCEPDGLDADDALRARVVGLDAFADACEQARPDRSGSGSFAAADARPWPRPERTCPPPTGSKGAAPASRAQPNPNPPRGRKMRRNLLD